MESVPPVSPPGRTRPEWGPLFISLAPAFLFGIAIMFYGYMILWAKGRRTDSEIPSLFDLFAMAMVFVLQRWTFRLWKNDRGQFWLVFGVSVLLVAVAVALRVSHVVKPPI